MLKITYILISFTVAAAAGILYLSGNFIESLLTILGFLVSTLLLMGIVAVRTCWVDKQFK